MVSGVTQHKPEYSTTITTRVFFSRDGESSWESMGTLTKTNGRESTQEMLFLTKR